MTQTKSFITAYQYGVLHSFEFDNKESQQAVSSMSCESSKPYETNIYVDQHKTFFFFSQMGFKSPKDSRNQYYLVKKHDR